MKTVGLLLRETRLQKGYTLEQVEAVTKIRVKFLAAIEADNTTNLPTPAITRGFVHNYAEFLGLDSRLVLAILRRQSREIPKANLLPKGLVEPLNRSFFQLTPSRFLAMLLGILLIIFLLYFGLQYRQIRQPPPLSIDAPKDQLVTSQKRIDIIGKTDADATVVINGVSVLVRSDGRFFDTVTLENGVNKITVSATSRFGKTTTETREVGYQP
ncbi:helix-turn-helix domain-containing protein [Candidatus Gottesmanbacteria bacterium]|nr:helix-turn-helix domain-containing protein [Candidatus Gottesmanbacteria bacterium]